MNNNMIIYISKDGNIKVDVNVVQENLWMSQDLMANLYGTTKNNISIHLKNIFEEGEIYKDSVVKKILTTAADGKKYNVIHYTLDAIAGFKKDGYISNRRSNKDGSYSGVEFYSKI